MAKRWENKNNMEKKMENKPCIFSHFRPLCCPRSMIVDSDDMPRLGQQPDGSFLPLQAVVGGTTTTHDGLMGLVYKPYNKWLIF